MEASRAEKRTYDLTYSGDSFSRLDETDDRVFYARDRFVSHLDSTALDTVERLIGDLIVEKSPAILDLMAGWDSHIPEGVKASLITGLGLNENELESNGRLTERVLHDINADPRLSFDDESFDVVVNTVSVDYMTRPFEVFEEVARILKPGGLFLVIFSNRMFPNKAVKLWRMASETERITFVEDFFRASHAFHDPRLFVSKGKPRPGDDKYAGSLSVSDPVYAVYAEKLGDRGDRPERPVPASDAGPLWEKEEVERRKQTVKHTLLCPHCGERMKKWIPPNNPWSDWDIDHLYGCFNDECPYYVNGWSVMSQQGNPGTSYRQMYNPDRDNFMPFPVRNSKSLKESIAEE